MTAPEFVHTTSLKMGSEQSIGLLTKVGVYDGLAGLLDEPGVYDRLVGAYCSAFGRPPWNEEHSAETVGSKLVRQLTIPGTQPIIVTMQKGEQFGFAWGCDGEPETIIPAAVRNDFPNLAGEQQEEMIDGVLKEVRTTMPAGKVFWGCELGTDPPGGSFFLRLVREEARRAGSDTLFGMTTEGTSFLDLMRARGGYQEIQNPLLPEGHHYFLQDLGKFVQRKEL